MNTEVGKPSSCLDGFDLLLQPIFALPFDSNTEVVCTHSKGVGSHSYPNTFYSLDIGTDYTKNSPPGTVIASADGTAYVFLGENGNPCPLPNGTPTNADSSDCGNGWGNHIKILHENGYFSFYVHLEKVLIKTGDIIKKGQPIGIEGYTGSAGHRHLHWSIQKLPGLPEEWATQILTYSGNSVPFQFKANVDGTTQILSSDSFHCPHAGIGNSNSPQPRLTGTLD